jgi:hypothetical protein
MTIDHSKILNAYLARITRADWENLLKHDDKCLQQQLNGNMTGQIEAQKGFYAAVCNAVNNLSTYDKELINKLVLEAI